MSLPSGFQTDVPLKSLTSWIVGGNADLFAQPKTVEELEAAYAWGLKTNTPITILGGGTNVLISDKGIRGLTISLKYFAQTSVEIKDGRFHLECLAGTSKSELLKQFLKAKLEPALFLAGVPGDAGGGVVMNAGIAEPWTPREFVEIVDWIEVMRPGASPLKVDRIDAKDLKWSYRHCEGWRPGIITRIGLSWPNEPKDDVLVRVRDANKVRLSKQPLDQPSCGSVFVNPPGFKSGQLIESSGLKGFTVGGAKVSEKHANFIVNFDNAKASDVHAVITNVKAKVFEKHGVQLTTEVVYLGDWT